MNSVNDIKVSIVCNAFNHEDYIKDALDSFLMQKTNFKFEVLVHDDASTDNTASIIKEYEEKYPDIIKPIYQTVNQYSQKIPIGDTYQFPRAKGIYIAVCEGDDFWTDPYKLQKQYDALESHPEIDMCAHAAIQISAQTKEKIGDMTPANESTVFSVEDIIKGGGGFLATNSLMFRKKLMENPPAFRKFLTYDYTLQIYGSLRGGLLYLKDSMSAYRVMANGSWTVRVRKNLDQLVNHLQKNCQMLDILNEETKFKYQQVIQEVSLKKEFEILEVKQDYKSQLKRKYKNVLKQKSVKERIKIRLKAYFPFLSKFKSKGK